MMFSRQHQNNLSTKREEEDGEKRQNHVEEEEDVVACLSFRNLAGDSSVNDLFPPYSDGDIEFEFLPMVIPDSTLAQVSFYPIFGGNDDDHQTKMKVLDLSIDNPEKEKKSERSISESKLDETWSSRKDYFGRPPKFVAKISFLPPPPMSTRRRSRIEKCKSTAATGRSLSRWRRVINLLIGKNRSSDGKERLFLTRNKSTSPTPTNTMKKVSKDDRKRLTYLPYRSNLVALFPVNRNIERFKF